jgi:GTP pyrophosphokinase
MAVGTSAKTPEDARAFAQRLLGPVVLDSGENAFDHACGMVDVLQSVQGPPPVLSAAWLAEAVLHSGEDTAREVQSGFGSEVFGLIEGCVALFKLEQTTRRAVQQDGTSRRKGSGPGQAVQRERARQMLMAFSSDLRGILLHVASRLQTLRWHAKLHQPPAPAVSQEALEQLAPLAQRLGLAALKWEIEDLAFRFLQPDTYHALAQSLQAKRTAREADVQRLQTTLGAMLRDAGIDAQVHGRAKHIYSIWRKMQGKRLGLEGVLDLRALRVLVSTPKDCYAALALVHATWAPVAGEFDDYIAKPKTNGYQSLHTVVMDDGRPVEVQVRTLAMHEHAEHGVAAHWAYKEAGTKGYAGAAADATGAARVARARRTLLNQLLAWQEDMVQLDGAVAVAAAGAQDGAQEPAHNRVYVFTPQAAIIDLPAGSTPIDFAYAVHTSLGHRCRGARVDGAMVPLTTALKMGQTVELTVAKEGGPSMDWLRADAGYLASPRSKTKVRAWFNAQVLADTAARGRERLERHLQRAGKTATKHQELAQAMGLTDAQALYVVAGKDELAWREVDRHLGLHESTRGANDKEVSQAQDGTLNAVIDATSWTPSSQRSDKSTGRSDVLVVGVESLLTGLAKCCRPAPPDAIVGFVTRHKGVAIHRASCINFKHMASQSAQRVCEVAWGVNTAGSNPNKSAGGGSRFAIDLTIEAHDRPGLLRDVTEVLAKLHTHIVAVQSHTAMSGSQRIAWMTITVDVEGAQAVPTLLAPLARVPGVKQARRR